MISPLTIISALAACALAAPPSTTPALQTYLSISDLDASQASAVESNFGADATSYFLALTTDPGYSSAYSAIATALPSSAWSRVQDNPGLFLASLAKESDDQPDWFTSMPTPAQAFWESAGSEYIDMYTSEVDAARPLPTAVSASLSSLSSKVASASSKAAAESSKAESSAAKASAAQSSAIQKGAAPASPATSGHMMVVAAGVVIAASLVGMAML
ncbi:MAG: hypothetical protein Q9170_007962 [Blastenia crenularia]